MRILIYTLYYWPEPTHSGPVVADVAAFLASRGWQVDVLTAMPKMPQWQVYPEYRGKWSVRETHDGVNIARGRAWVPSRPASGRMSAWKRILFDSSIVISTMPLAWGMRRPDIIVSVTPPLQVGAAAIVLGRVWGCPMVNWLHDIVPDAALNVGMMHEGRMVRLARKLESFVYEHADRIAVLSSGMAENLRHKNVPAAKLTLLTNFASLERFDAPSQREEYRERLGIAQDAFVVMHAGSLSPKQVMENAIRAMKLLEHDGHFQFLMLGDGICKPAIEEEMRRLGASNCRFLGTVADSEFVQTLRVADALLVNQSKDLVDALVPSKLLTYLPTGLPVLAAVHEQSEAARFVRDSGAGVVVEPENPERLAKAIVELSQRADDRLQMGSAGAKYAREFYDKPAVLTRFEQELKQLITDQKSGKSNLGSTSTGTP